MQNNHPSLVGAGAVSPTYVYIVGETDTFYYTKNEQTVEAAKRLRPKLARKYSTLSRTELAAMLASLVDNDWLEKLFATHPVEMIQARMVLLLDAYIKDSPAFSAAVASGFDSVVYTAFRTADGNYVVRICGAVTKRGPMTTADAIAVAREILRLPWISSLYENDGLAPSSIYHLIARKTA